MKIKIPENVTYIIQTLNENGFEAYAVGGCVRDSILECKPKDWDITTSAKPQEVKKLFRRTIDTGIIHGTVTVMLDKEGYEVTTYRIDGEYEDNRHPTAVEFTTNLVEDLKRRDFTINAMAYNPAEGLVDAFGGMEDIKKQVIRCVGLANERFDEDALRILRAVRFSGQLGFTIEEETRRAIREKAIHLQNISAERIRTELSKLLLSSRPDRLKEAYDLGITNVILPQFHMMMETQQKNPHHLYSVGEHTIKAIEAMNILYKKEEHYDERVHAILCWTMLLHDVAKPLVKTTDQDGIDHFYGHEEESAKIAKEILMGLKFDNYTMDKVVRLVRWHDYMFHLKKSSLRRAVNRIGEDIMEWMFLVKKADMYGQNPLTIPEKEDGLQAAFELYQEILKDKDCITLKDLKINGQHLIELGVPKGKDIGRILNQLLERVLEDPNLNEFHTLLSLARELL